MLKYVRKPIVAALLGVAFATPAAACSSEPYLGSMCVVAFTFCPRGYADANGQLLSIAQNQALFSLLGTTYGGNGQTTFALPDLRGRVPLHVGQGPGLSPIDQGEVSGAEQTTLTIGQMPSHTHLATQRASAGAGTSDTPVGNIPARLARSNNYAAAGTDAMKVDAISVANAGGNQPIGIRDPYVGMRHCIAMEGIFPSRP